MEAEITISLKSITKRGETYGVSLPSPLSNEAILELCRRDENDTGLVTDCGNNKYLCQVYRGGQSCDLTV